MLTIDSKYLLPSSYTRWVRRKVCGAYSERRLRRVTEYFSNTTPIFVLGTQKTGSTAIAALLAEATGLGATLDLPYRSKADETWYLARKYEMISFADVLVRYKREFDRPIVKEPWLTHFYPELREYFPNAKYVMIQRHPLDTIRSVLNRLGMPGELEAINFDDWQSLVDFPVWRLALDTSWLGWPSYNFVEALALKWNLAAKLYLSAPSNFTLIHYEDFIRDKVGAIERLARQLNHPCTNNIDAIKDVQHQSKGQKMTDIEGFFGPENYHLIKSCCVDNAAKLGYQC